MKLPEPIGDVNELLARLDADGGEGLDLSPGDPTAARAAACIRALISEWVPVSLMLPKYGESVLVTDGKEVGHAYRLHTDAKGEHWFIVGGNDEEHDEWNKVSHWMPEPKITIEGAGS